MPYMLEENYPWWCPNCNYEAIPKSSKMWNMVQRLHRKTCKKEGRTKENEVDGEICRRQTIIQNGPGFKTADPYSVDEFSKKYNRMDSYLEERGLEEKGAGFIVRKDKEEEIQKECECTNWVWKCETCLKNIVEE